MENPESSPFTEAKAAAFESLMNEALSQHAESKKLRLDAKKATALRDKAIGSVASEGTLRSMLAALRDILKGRYKNNEYMLGDWGFNVIINNVPAFGGGSLDEQTDQASEEGSSDSRAA